MGDFNHQQLPLRRLQTLWEWKNRVLLEEYYNYNNCNYYYNYNYNNCNYYYNYNYNNYNYNYYNDNYYYNYYNVNYYNYNNCS